MNQRCSTFETHCWGPCHLHPVGVDWTMQQCLHCSARISTKELLELQARVAAKDPAVERIATSLEKIAAALCEPVRDYSSFQSIKESLDDIARVARNGNET